MLILGIALCYLLGFSVLLKISKKFSLPEAIGFSFLIGIGLETVFLFVLDILQMHYSSTLLIGLNLAAIVALTYKYTLNMQDIKDEVSALKPDASSINYVALFLFCIVAYLFYAIMIKNLFWPPAEGDSITSFDKLGRIMATEGKLKISLFQYNLQGAAGIYPPLFHGSFAYVYIFGAETPKIIITLFFLSFLLLFYQFVKGYVGATAAMLFTLILMATPELYAHAALALGNMPTAAYLCAAVLSIYVWLDKGDVKYFWTGAIMMAFAVWIRSDAIAFVAASLFIVLLHVWRTKDFKRLLIYGAFTVIPFVGWLMYVKLKIQMPQAARFNLATGYNAERLNTMLNYVKSYLGAVSYREVHGGQLFGIVFVSFFIALIINAGLAFNKGAKTIFGNHGLLLIFLLISFGIYFTEFYLINEEVQAASIASLMASSFKRGMFYFIPLVLFYTATCYSSKIVFERLEKYRTGL